MGFTSSLDTVANCGVKMAKLILLFGLLGLQIGVSMESPPRVSSCRIVHKAKPQSADWSEVYNFTEGQSCVAQVTLQNTDDAMINITDPRNCENFYKCQGLSCFQCPCPAGQTFNPETLRCDESNAVCECEQTETEIALETTTTISTDISISTITTEVPGERVIPPANTNQKPTTLEPPANTTNNGIAIIAVIVAATVIILAALVIGFCLWQRGIFPLRKKPPMHPSTINDGYLQTLPPQDRNGHVYAEIDERSTAAHAAHEAHTRQMAEDARRQLQHIYAPPIPSSQPPPPACTHHPHQTFTLPPGHQPRLYPQFSGYPMPPHTPTSPQLQQSRDLIRFHSPTSEMNNKNINQNNNHSIIDCDEHSEVTSCSGCSHCSSALSNQIPVDQMDRRNFIMRGSNATPPLTQWTTAVTTSKHMYV